MNRKESVYFIFFGFGLVLVASLLMFSVLAAPTPVSIALGLSLGTLFGLMGFMCIFQGFSSLVGD